MKIPKFYRKKKSRSAFVTKGFLCCVVLGFFAISLMALDRNSNIKIPQKEIVIKVDIKDKINICLPDEKMQ